MPELYHGAKGRIYISVDGAGAAVAIVSLTDWSVDQSADTVETTCLGDTNKKFMQGLPNLSGSFSGFWDAAQDVIARARKSSTGCKMYIYPSLDYASAYLYGPAWLSTSIQGGVGDAVKVSGNFVAKDNWGAMGGL